MHSSVPCTQVKATEWKLLPISRLLFPLLLSLHVERLQSGGLLQPPAHQSPASAAAIFMVRPLGIRQRRGQCANRALHAPAGQW